jgi:hypothetical protein
MLGLIIAQVGDDDKQGFAISPSGSPYPVFFPYFVAI